LAGLVFGPDSIRLLSKKTATSIKPERSPTLSTQSYKCSSIDVCNQPTTSHCEKVHTIWQKKRSQERQISGRTLLNKKISKIILPKVFIHSSSINPSKQTKSKASFHTSSQKNLLKNINPDIKFHNSEAIPKSYILVFVFLYSI
jgi:hypothetical protein